jgi:hypothetical protein
MRADGITSARGDALFRFLFVGQGLIGLFGPYFKSTPAQLSPLATQQPQSARIMENTRGVSLCKGASVRVAGGRRDRRSWGKGAAGAREAAKAVTGQHTA